jgi:hypothetical protein
VTLICTMRSTDERAPRLTGTINLVVSEEIFDLSPQETWVQLFGDLVRMATRGHAELVHWRLATRAETKAMKQRAG